MGKSWLLVAFMLLVMIHSSLGLMKCKKHELDALSKFKHSFTQNPLSLLHSWVGDDCCHWPGVTCDEVTSNVIKLILQGGRVFGPMMIKTFYSVSEKFKPFNSVSEKFKTLYSVSEKVLVASEVSPALLELKFLTHLDLSWNDFSGNRIPEFIGSMTNLRYLNLSNAGFSGKIPPQLGNLTNLIHLDLNNALGNYMHYKEESLDEWAYGLSKLQSLDMSGINMSQAKDAIQVLFRIPTLLALSLSNCELQNTHLAEITLNTPSSTLQHLDLSVNYFKGPFPSFIKKLRHLKFLDLSENSFTHVEGGVWEIIGNPCNFKHLDLSSNLIVQEDILLEPSINSTRCAAYELEHLDLGSNKLNGSLPSLLGQLTNLKHLDLSRNRFQGRVSESLAKLSALKYLGLSHNRLSGLMPDVFGNLTELVLIDISSNSIQGTISGINNLSKLSYLDTSLNNLNLTMTFNSRPPFQLLVFRVHSCGINTVFPQWLRNQTHIFELDLSNTGISGDLPEWLGNLTFITELQLSNNQLTGSLPRHIACDGCYLDVLDLHNNMLSGTIPHWFSHLEASLINLSNNKLSGRIFERENSSSILTNRQLIVLDFSDNMLSGEIQIQIKSVYPPTIQALSLRGNYFSGSISSQLCHFSDLVILELAHNNFSGHIPRCLGSLLFNGSIGWYYDDSSTFAIQEIIKGTMERFTGAGVVHSILDLSSNHLVGTIPVGLTSKLSKLMELNLSNNHLTGSIPGDIGNLQELESLDLSNNNLSGTIPQTMSTIFGLSVLNLSNNHLRGPIPTGRQLQTLDNPSIYAGNSGLCGFPLPNNCTQLDPPPTPTDDIPGSGEEDDMGDKHEKMWFYLVIMSGVAAGFWGVVGTLVFKKSWRHSYFRFVEETGDKIYVPLKVRVNKNSRQRKKTKAENSGQ